MNFYEKKNKKSAFSIKELASLLNVSEEKIKELENGERNISGDTLEEYLKFANMSLNEKKIKRLELLNWFKGIDIKRIREEFGFKSQKDFISIRRDVYEDMEAKIKRYEKIIDYILKEEK